MILKYHGEINYHDNKEFFEIFCKPLRISSVFKYKFLKNFYLELIRHEDYDYSGYDYSGYDYSGLAYSSNVGLSIITKEAWNAYSDHSNYLNKILE